MTDHAVRAEWDALDGVRVHTPGLELWSGSLDPGPNLFADHVPPDRARREHGRIVTALEDAGVEVHHLADDLAAAGALDDLVRESVTDRSGENDRIEGLLDAFDPREKLQAALARATIADDDDDDDGGPSLRIDRPLSNTYFQRDTTLVGDRGPVLCAMHEPVRRPEVPIVREAWAGVGAEIRHEAGPEPIEGGEFLPAGEFALLGVSAVVDGEERVIRTSYAAGEDLLAADAVGYDEVGLVRAPLAADRRLRVERGLGSRVMHLLGWCNVAAEGLAVLDADLAAAAEVDVYARRGDGYELDRTTTTLSYLAEDRGFDVIDVAPAERWPTNFLTVEDGRIVPLYEPDDEGAYDPEPNPTIEALRRRGVEILPDGEGLARGALTDGAGGIHCMTTPLGRA